jgi:hypothetical protein
VGAASDTNDFPLTVKAQMTDADAVAAAKAALDIGYATGDADTGVTQNLSLPVTVPTVAPFRGHRRSGSGLS